MKYLFAVFSIFLLFESVTIGKTNLPFFFKCFFVTFKTSFTNWVPSSPQSHGIPFLYQGEITATFFAIADDPLHKKIYNRESKPSNLWLNLGGGAKLKIYDRKWWKM